MIQYFSVKQNQLTSIDQEAIFANPDDAKWINVESPTKTEIQELATLYQIPIRYLTSILDDNENARVRNLGTSSHIPTMLLLSYPKYTTSPLGYLSYKTFPINFIIVDQLVITIANHPASFIHHFVMSQESMGNMLADSKWFLTHMLWFIAREFVLDLNDISHQMDHLEKQLTSATQNEQIYQIMALQKTLIEFESALSQNKPVLAALDSESYLTSDHATRLNNAAMVENTQALSMCHNQSKVLDQYSNMVSAVVSNNLNDVMKILTSITLILTIPTIIGGLYGMNVKLPGANLATAFSLLLLATIIICLITLRILKRHNYM